MNTILYHLRTKFDPDRLERVANTLLRRDILELLPEQVEVYADFHLRPYYGDEDNTENLYHSEAKRGTPCSTPTRRSTPLLETVWYRVELSIIRASDSDDNDARFHGEAAVRRGESAVTERVAVSPLRIRGDARLGGASPLVVAVQGVREYGLTGCMDGPRGASGRPRESATGRPFPPKITDRGHRLVSGYAVASAVERRRQRQVRLRSVLGMYVLSDILRTGQDERFQV